jgi:hypothetical protein
LAQLRFEYRAARPKNVYVHVDAVGAPHWTQVYQQALRASRCETINNLQDSHAVDLSYIAETRS